MGDAETSNLTRRKIVRLAISKFLDGRPPPKHHLACLGYCLALDPLDLILAALLMRNGLGVSAPE